jgi:hypothetical protein
MPANLLLFGRKRVGGPKGLVDQQVLPYCLRLAVGWLLQPKRQERWEGGALPRLGPANWDVLSLP